MKSRVTIAISFAAALVLGAGMTLTVVSPAWSQQSSGPQVSRAAAKQLKAAQDAMKARKYSEALAKLREVQAVPGKTAYDQYLADEMLGFISVSTKNFPEAARALEAGLNSGFLPQAEVPKRVVALAQVNYQLKNYPKALEYGNRAVKGGYAQDALYTLMAQAYYLKGEYRTTQRFVESYVDSLTRRGQTPKEQYLQLINSSCMKINDTDCVTRTLERLVTFHPKPEYWQNLVSSMFQAKDQTDKNLLHVYRLANEVDILKRADDFTEMAQLAQEEGSFGEAERVLLKGFERKVFTDERAVNKNKRLLAVIMTNVAQDKASLPKEAQQAAASKNGDEDVSVGLAFLSYKQYPQAIAAFQRGLTKPLANPTSRSVPEVRLLLGIAQLESGDKDSAVKTFKSVKGDAKFERLANLWSLHARQA